MSDIAPVTPLLSLRRIHKRFPGVHALKDVQLDVRAGEVHALVGENGAGKSTLVHILAGVYQPDEGTMDFNGQTNVTIANEHAAQQLGIAIVFQERSLFSTLSVAENIFAARQPVKGWGRIDRKKLFAATQDLLKQVGLEHIRPETLLSDLSPAQQQMIEIAKALSLQAKLIIFDEPTAALTASETDALFTVIRQLQREGVGILYISHRLEEIFALAQRVTVLKDGEWQGTFSVEEMTPGALVARMVGRELSVHQRAVETGPARGQAVLAVRGWCDAEALRGTRPFLHDIDFDAHAGEVVVLAGLAGAGRTELALSLFGARRRGSGELKLAGQPMHFRNPADAIAAGLAYASEDRKDAGLFLDMTIAANIVAANLRQFGTWHLDDTRASVAATAAAAQLRVGCRDVGRETRELSGGNQQKIVLAKWLLLKPRVLIVDEPTRGIDVGAKAEVHALLRAAARNGAAVIVISSDLPEVLAVADRIVVMREGRIAGEVASGIATKEAVMALAAMPEGKAVG